MNYEIDPKPTTYRSVRFRSRLEATWACLFDRIGMPWEYEPQVDVQGWLPDFRLFGRFLVEVKPIEPEGYLMAYGDHGLVAKAVRPERTILLGNGPGSTFGALLAIGGADTIVYDPHRQFLMRRVAGVGDGGPQEGALERHWAAAIQTIRDMAARPEPTQRVAMSADALPRSSGARSLARIRRALKQEAF